MQCEYPSFTGRMNKEDWNGETVFVFGTASVDDAISPKSVRRILEPNGAALNDLQTNLAPEDMLGGVAFVLPESMDADMTRAVSALQQQIIYVHYKYVHFPAKSLSTNDVAGVRKEPLPDVVRNINVLGNYPWLLNAPLVDKLAAARLGLPVLVLLPGPSGRALQPHLKAIRERCLIVCVGKSLSLCLEAGIHPDIVIQFDTYQIQRAFYEGVEEMPETVLVPLSICPFHHYAAKFRGVIMMDSFDMELLPNPARLRESYVSSLTPCLGLAEALSAPHTFIAGANLAMHADEEPHPYPGREEPPYPVYPANNRLYYSTRDDSPAKGFEYYLATSVEADHYAREIRATAGTHFYTMSDSTMLSQEWYPMASVETILQLPVMNRTRYLEIVDKVLASKETVQLTKARVRLLAQLKDLRQLDQAFNNDATPREMLEKHILTRATKQMRNPVVGEGLDRVAVAARLCTRWRRAVENALLLVRAKTFGGQGKPIPVLCFGDEAESLMERLSAVVPGAKWAPHTIRTSPQPPFEYGPELYPNSTLSWLAAQQVVFVSPAILRVYAYLFDCAQQDNLYDTGQLG